MNWLCLLSGIALVIAVLLDALKTTLVAAGGGLFTRWVSDALWRLALIAHGATRSRHHQILRIAGTAILLSAAATWIILLWAGWTLIFSSAPMAVVDASSRVPADLPARIYFCGYTLFTLGIGDYVPHGGGWQVVTAVASLNTLSITYLVPVISAVTQKSQLAACVADLGGTPVDIVLRAWAGGRFPELAADFRVLAAAINLHTERHLAYPVLHYFHSPAVRTSVAPNLAALDDALLLLQHGVAPEVRPAAPATHPLRSAISGYLEVIEGTYMRKSEPAPPLPEVTRLIDAGIPVVAPEEFRRAAEEASDRRKLLHSLVTNDGWGWHDVVRKPGSELRDEPAASS